MSRINLTNRRSYGRRLGQGYSGGGTPTPPATDPETWVGYETTGVIPKSWSEMETGGSYERIWADLVT